MDIFLSREAIRNRVAARLGYLTADGQGALTADQHNAWIQQANLDVVKRCQWVRNGAETRVSIGIDQRFVNYPAQTGPGNIMAIAYWSEGRSRYLPLQRRKITLAMDDDPLVDEGEPASVAGRGEPRFYECKDQIEIWPRSDQEYELKIDHTILVDLNQDTDISVVDAEAIILLVLAEAYDHQGETTLGDRKRAQAYARLDELVRLHSNDSTVNLNAGRHARANRDQIGEYVPTSGSWPSEVP